MALLTLFTTPKPFKDPHIVTIQRNALQSWKALDEDVEIVLVGDEHGMPEIAEEFGLIHRPEARINEQGTPLISSIFDLGRAENSSPYLAYVNTDIILFPDFIYCSDNFGFFINGSNYSLSDRTYKNKAHMGRWNYLLCCSRVRLSEFSFAGCT